MQAPLFDFGEPGQEKPQCKCAMADKATKPVTVDRSMVARERRIYKLAIKALWMMRARDVASADAARFGFGFGEKAAARVANLDEAIGYFKDLLEGLG